MERVDETIMVSVICTAYNHEPYIRQCLEGFVMQKTNFRFEAIVHDDASTDGTAAIIREYEQKYPDIIKAIYQTENQYSKKDGSIARIIRERIKGKYYAQCEGDDYWIDPYKLQKQVDLMEENPDVSLCHTSFKFYYQAQNRFLLSNDIKINYRPAGYKLSQEEILSGKYRIQTVTTMFRTEQFLLARSQNLKLFNPGMFLMGDIKIWYCLNKIGSIAFIPEVTAVYRKAANSATKKTNIKGELRFELSSAELRKYISTMDVLSSTYLQVLNSNYNKALLRYLSFVPAYTPMFPLEDQFLPSFERFIWRTKSFKFYAFLIKIKYYIRKRLGILLRSVIKSY